MNRAAIIFAAAILATSPTFAASSRGTASPGVRGTGTSFVRHGEVESLGPPQFYNGAPDARIESWMHAPEGSERKQLARMCGALPGPLQAGCLDRINAAPRD